MIYGATSYVAHGVARVLVGEGYRLLAVTRRPSIAAILLDELGDHIEVISSEEFSNLMDPEIRAIVNFAYVRHKTSRLDLYPQTRAIVEAVDNAGRRHSHARLIHMSTQSVFGYQFQGQPSPSRVARRRGDEYVESKIFAEHFLEGARKGEETPYPLAIVRLGNVIGPAAPAFVAGLAQRIIEGRPVGWLGRMGPSNTTYIDNIASYVRALIEATPQQFERFGVYHHLAEFSDRNWAEVLARIAGAVGHEHRLTEYWGGERSLDMSTIRHAVRGGARRLYHGPLGSAVLRRMAWLAEVPQLDEFAMRIKTPDALVAPPVTPDERWLFDDLANPFAFLSHTLEGWVPQFTFDAAMDACAEWLEGSGYALGERKQRL